MRKDKTGAKNPKARKRADAKTPMKDAKRSANTTSPTKKDGKDVAAPRAGTPAVPERVAPPRRASTRPVGATAKADVEGATAPRAATVEEKLDVLFITSEMRPFARTGGLSDVSSALPRALARRGDRVTVV